MKKDCLHCILVKAAAEWKKTHHAAAEELNFMIGRAVCEILETDVVILGVSYVPSEERLH